ncbi:hypothetical protein DXG01_006680 [Tephrocybe rancida]|nr:hypothetical protein DXG01_006680 [Tephrocybe rancida]
MRLIDSKRLRDGPEMKGFAPLEKFLYTGGAIKSVLYLEHFVEVEDSDFRPHKAILVDYGFLNCKDATDFDNSKGLYKQIFGMPRGSPVDLQKARIQGKLFNFVDKLITLKKKVTRKRMWRILKNPYPLPDI